MVAAIPPRGICCRPLPSLFLFPIPHSHLPSYCLFPILSPGQGRRSNDRYSKKPWNGARMSPELEFKIANLPDSPGCYLMKSEGEIIYVGKAKNLKNRVSQYFHWSAQHTPKVRAMVEKIDDFDIMLVDNELEAFTLECNLIKLHMPHYNILLKDDKAYPYIRVDLRQPFPRVELVRRQEKDGAKYFGPYQGATVVREVLDVVRMVFPIRVCAKKLNPEKPLRPCVHHQVGQCPAPCAGLISGEDYRQTIDGHRLPERQIRPGAGRAEGAHDGGLEGDELRARRPLPRPHPRRGGRDAEAEGHLHRPGRPGHHRRAAPRRRRHGAADVRALRADDRLRALHAGGRGGRAPGRDPDPVHAAILRPGDHPAPGDPALRHAAGARRDRAAAHRAARRAHLHPHPPPGREAEAGAHGHQEPEGRGPQAGPQERQQPRPHHRRAGGAAAGAGPAHPAPAHRGLRHLQHPGRPVRGQRGGDGGRRQRQQGVSPLPHQDRGGRQRLRQHVRGHHPPPVPRAGRAGRAQGRRAWTPRAASSPGCRT